MTFSGKEEIARRHQLILDTFLNGSNFEVEKLRLRQASNNIVIAHVYWKVTNIKPSRQKTLPSTLKGIFTHTLINNEGKWQITSTQNTSSFK